MRKLTLFFGLVLIVILIAGCNPGKEVVQASKGYLDFKNTYSSLSEKSLKVDAAKFDTLDLSSYCLNYIKPGAYYKYSVSSGPNGRIFILDMNKTIVCEYSITPDGILWCDKEKCDSKEKMVFDAINKPKDPALNVHLSSKESINFSLYLMGTYYVDYYNDIQDGAGDSIKAGIEQIYPSEPIFSETYHLGEKTKIEMGYQIKPMNVSNIIYIDDGASEELCFEKNGDKIYCSSNSSEVGNFTSIFNNTKELNEKLFSNGNITKVYSSSEKGTHCLDISTSDYGSIKDLYTDDKFMETTDSLLGNISSVKMEKFMLSVSYCMKEGLNVMNSFEMNVITNNFTLIMTDKTNVDKFEYNSVTDDAFKLPDGAITSCQDQCEEKKCKNTVCTFSTDFKCTYSIIEDCCGNGVCELKESYSKCKEDCRGLADAIKGKKLKDYFPLTFYNGNWGLLYYNQDDGSIAHAFLNEEEGTIAADYASSLSIINHTTYLSTKNINVYTATINIHQGPDEKSYKKVLKDSEDYAAYLLSEFEGYKDMSFNFRDIKVNLVLKDLMSYCSGYGNSYTSGIAYIDIPSEETVILMSFGECADVNTVTQAISSYLTWLADHTKPVKIYVKEVE